MFDYIVGITIGSIASTASIELNQKLMTSLLGVVIWGAAPVLLGYGALKSQRLRKWFTSEPTVLIKDGQIQEESLAVTRFNLEDLMARLCQKDVFDLSKVEAALLETNGEISVLKKAEKQPVTPSSLGITVAATGVPTVLVQDGQILKDTLEASPYDEEWLKRELKQQGVENLKDVVFAQVNSKGDLYIDLQKDSERALLRPQQAKIIKTQLAQCVAQLGLFALDTEDEQRKRTYRDLADDLRSASRDFVGLL